MEFYKIRLNSNEILQDAYRDRSAMADVTIHCEDGTVKVHRMVLISHSKFMVEALKLVPFGKPADVFLMNHRCKEVNLLVDLLYKGEVSVESGSMSRLTTLMDDMKIESSVIPHGQA